MTAIPDSEVDPLLEATLTLHLAVTPLEVLAARVADPELSGAAGDLRRAIQKLCSLLEPQVAGPLGLWMADQAHETLCGGGHAEPSAGRLRLVKEDPA